MPQNKSSTQQYLVRLAAGENKQGIAPNTPNRTKLVVQNTGANPALLKFNGKIVGAGGATIGDGSEFVLYAGDMPFTFSDPCPVEAFSIASILGTTVSVLETTETL